MNSTSVPVTRLTLTGLVVVLPNSLESSRQSSSLGTRVPYPHKTYKQQFRKPDYTTTKLGLTMILNAALLSLVLCSSFSHAEDALRGFKPGGHKNIDDTEHLSGFRGSNTDVDKNHMELYSCDKGCSLDSKSMGGPVCGSDGFTYFNECLAICQVREEKHMSPPFSYYLSHDASHSSSRNSNRMLRSSFMHLVIWRRTNSNTTLSTRMISWILSR